MTTDTETIAHLQERYPEIHVAVHKGWIEMIHRYIAGGLGLLIMGIAYLGYREKDKTPNYPYLVSLALLGLVVIQGAFRCVHSDAEVVAEYRDTAFDGWTDHRFDADVFASSTQTSSQW